MKKIQKYFVSSRNVLEQRTQALVRWFTSHTCIVDARVIYRETVPGYPPKMDVAFSFMDNGVVMELILNFSTTNKVLSYYFDMYNGVFVKTNRHFTIDKVFDFINSLELDVKLINYGIYISTMSSDNLQYILDNLNAKPYTSDGNAWKVSGYLHYSTNQITVFPRLYNMKNKDYQADWLKTMNDYELVEWVELDYNRYTIFDKSI